MKDKIIKNWYYIAVYIGCMFGLLLCLGNWNLRMKTLLAGTLFIHLHFFEEFGYPGGFPWQGMQVERGMTECRPEEWDLTMLSAFFGNEWFAVFVYILPMFLNIKFMTLAAVIFTFAELLMHLIVFNAALKKWYNPGLASVLIGLLPVSVNYLYQIRGLHLYSLADVLLAVAWIVFHYWAAFLSPLYKKMGADKKYAFTVEEATGRSRFLS
ncbi:MAG: HXXEE domain-containing protein [Brotaphodocola sp.]